MVSENKELFDLNPWKAEEKPRQKPRSGAEKALDRLDEVEERLLKNLEGRANRGEKLTAADYGILQDLRQRLEHRRRDGLPDHVVPTAKAVAEYFSRTVRTIRNWAGRGMPQLPNGYDLRAIEIWGLQEGIIKESRIKPDQGNKVSGSCEGNPDGPDRAHYELEIKRLDSELKGIKLQRETGALILRQDVERGWVDRAFELKRDLLSMARRLSLRGANKEAPVLYEILKQDAMEVLRKYSRGNVDPGSLEVPENGKLDG